MSKILFLIGSLQAGGAERVASRLCSQWAIDDDVTLASADSIINDFYSVDNGVKRISLDFNYRRKGLFGKTYEQLKRFLSIVTAYKNENPDVVIVSCSDISIRSLCSLLFINKPIIVCEHNNYFALRSTFKRLCRLVLYRKATHLLLLTSRDIENYTQRRFPKQLISVMPNPLGIENNKYIPKKNLNSLLAVGRLCEQKAFDRLIELFLNVDPQCTLNIIGDGPERVSLQEKIDTLGLSKRITLQGQVKNISDYYNNSSVLLMTSIYEGLPMVIGEANAFGLPVIAYDCPTGPREMIEHGVNGYLIKDGEQSSFIATVNELVATPELYKKMSNSAFVKAKSRSIGEISKLWKKLIV